jgi:hypothetical protein
MSHVKRFPKARDASDDSGRPCPLGLRREHGRPVPRLQRGMRDWPRVLSLRRRLRSETFVQQSDGAAIPRHLQRARPPGPGFGEFPSTWLTAALRRNEDAEIPQIRIFSATALTLVQATGTAETNGSSPSVGLWRGLCSPPPTEGRSTSSSLSRRITTTTATRCNCCARRSPPTRSPASTASRRRRVRETCSGPRSRSPSTTSTRRTPASGRTASRG